MERKSLLWWSAYPKYRDTGVEWLGSIPSQWGVAPLFHLLRERFVRNTENQVKDVLSLSYGRIVPRDVDSNFGLLPVSFETYQIVEPGNIVLRLTDLQNDRRSLRVGHVGQRGIITSAYVSLETAADMDNRFAFYLLNAYDLLKVFYGMGAGVRQTMKFADLKRMPCVVPSRPEQEAIASYLDRETAKTDELIEKLERLIERLEEKRKALISHAVTQGLKPNVKMKDSGVEWLGKIPEHWEVNWLKHCVGFQEGPGIMAADFRDSGTPLLRISCLGGREANLNGCDYLDPGMVARRWNHFAVRNGDYLLSASASMGAVCRVPECVAGAIPYTGIIRLWTRTPSILSMEFLRFFMMCPVFTTQVDLFRSGVGIQHFGPTHLKRMLLLLPPIREQLSIVGELEREMSRFQALEQKVQALILQFRERRTALISAAVTGKIRVTGDGGDAVEV